MVAEAKAALREAMLRRRAALPEDERATLGARVLDVILQLSAYRHAEVVLAYASFGTELPTDHFLRRVLADGKALLLPRVGREGLDLYEVHDLDKGLAPGKWGIREPIPDRCPPGSPADVGFALIPGVAFDGRGRRLGYGGGFYDHLLSGAVPEGTPLVSGAFEVQMVDEVPVGPLDVPVDAVVTEAAVYHREGRPEGP